VKVADCSIRNTVARLFSLREQIFLASKQPDDATFFQFEQQYIAETKKSSLTQGTTTLFDETGRTN
jgi:hypothetical protein